MVRAIKWKLRHALPFSQICNETMAVYTRRNADIVEAIVSECRICPAVNFKHGEMPPKVYSSQKALWDTGATNTLISSKIVTELELKPCGKSGFSSANGVVETNLYEIHLGVPTAGVVCNILALEKDDEDYEVVIGMDVISQGDFAFSNHDGRSTFSFRLPSQEEIVLK